MTCFELHTQLNQRLQAVASFKRDKFFPEELDMALNKAMFRLLEQGVDKGFTDDQINLSHVTALVQKNKIGEVIIPGPNDSLNEGVDTTSVYTIVPPDLYWTVNTRAEVIVDPLNCSTAPTLTTNTITEYISLVSLPVQTVAPYYSTTTITSNTQGLLYSSPSGITAGFPSLNSKYVVINNILEFFYRKYPTIKVYWERYRDVSYPGTFIFVSTINLGTVTFVSGGQTSTSANTTNSYTGYNRGLIAALPSKTVTIESTKVTEQDLLYQAQKQNYFYKTRKEEIIIDQTFDYFILYTEESFIVTRMYYDYIRKPKTISLALDQTCELADTTHPKLIDLAVEMLRLDIKDQNYPQTVQDTQLRTS